MWNYPLLPGQQNTGIFQKNCGFCSDHHNTVNIAIKPVVIFCWWRPFPSMCKNAASVNHNKANHDKTRYACITLPLPVVVWCSHATNFRLWDWVSMCYIVSVGKHFTDYTVAFYTIFPSCVNWGGHRIQIIKP